MNAGFQTNSKRLFDASVMDVEQLTAFLREAETEHTSDDWLERYADKAERELGVDRDSFLEKLTEANQAHHGYEAALSEPDPEHDWALWYAECMLSV